MSAKAQKIMERYEQSYVTDAQLERYLELGVITEEEYEVIYEVKHPKVEEHSEEVPEEEPVEAE